MLFGDKGYVDKFIKTFASPFLERSSRRGYHSKDVQGCTIDFKKSYFSFIRQGKRWLSNNRGQSSVNEHVIDVAAFPTEVNIEARIKPHMTRLVLDCPEGDTILENKQYPNEKKFVWSSGKSGDVTLQIMRGDITLTKTYSGYCAFGKFLHDFRNGKRTFTEEDFPNYRHDFARLGVNSIEVIYQLDPNQIAPVVRMLNTVPGRPPTIIVNGAQTG